MDFTTKIESGEISVYGIVKHLDLHKDTEISDVIATAIIKWRVEIDAREYGIKGISTIIDSIEADIEIEYYAHDDKECEDKIYNNFVLESKEFEIVDELEVNGDYLAPAEIEIDFDKKKITIS